MPPKHVRGDVIAWTCSGNKLHPAEKPLTVLTPLIKSFCVRGGVVLDPFAGSGSTCLAARIVGRNCLGLEIDPQVHEIVNRRLSGFMSRLVALAGTDSAAELKPATR